MERKKLTPEEIADRFAEKMRTNFVKLAESQVPASIGTAVLALLEHGDMVSREQLIANFEAVLKSREPRDGFAPDIEMAMARACITRLLPKTAERSGEPRAEAETNHPA